MNDASREKGLALAPLLCNVERFSGKALEREALRLYVRYCVEPASQGKVVTHDGKRVVIYRDERDFTHAFFTAGEKHRRGWAKDIIDPRRVERVRWIVPVISGLVEGTQSFRVVEYASYKKPPPEKRLYVVRGERYVVWLLRRGADDFRLRDGPR